MARLSSGRITFRSCAKRSVFGRAPSGEWLPASEARVRAEAANALPEARDAVGNLLNDGDSVVLIKDLPVKGAGQTLKVGTVIKSIRLTADPEEIDCRYEGIKGLVLRTEFVKKR